MKSWKGEKCYTQLREALGLPEQASPFPWQNRLLESFLKGQIPNAIDIPTGLGKTAVIAIWLVARAAGAPIPRRLVYVVDRRAVVDQATEVAERLRDFVERDTECKRLLGLDRPLPISTLRGQYVDNKDWLEDPASAAIIVGTVDMIGSRLLFEGYGVSRKMRPYHAGLLGADSLLVLDEAHLVQPFERLIEQIAIGVDAEGCALRSEGKLEALVPRFRFLSLSATGRDRQDQALFRLDEDDLKNSVMKRRLAAGKKAIVRPSVSGKELADTLAAEAWVLSNEGTLKGRIIIFCTSRDCAQTVQEKLHAKASKAGQQIDMELFVGGRRVYERRKVADWLRSHGFIPGSESDLEHTAVIIATAAGEVGVDLDADHAVCDLVAWERMVQRFGRVNRRGNGDATIVVLPEAAETEEEKVLLADRLRLFEVLPRTADGNGADVSPGALVSLKKDSELRSLIERISTPAPLYPPLTRALVESWSMTSLEDHTGRPEAEPWIRGWSEKEEELQADVVWRSILPITETDGLLGKQDFETFRNIADPHTVEKLQTETWRIVGWLEKRVTALEPEDPEDRKLSWLERPLHSKSTVAVILPPNGICRILRSDELSNLESRNRDRLARELAGAILIVDRRLRGLSNGLLAIDCEDEALDVTEVESEEPPSGSASKRVIPFRIRRADAGEEDSSSINWRIEATIPIAKRDDKITAWLVVESLVDQSAESEDGRSVARRAQLLDTHEEWAESDAIALATRLGLPPEYTEMLATAARLHDEGKKVDRWQRAFNAPNGGRLPYAKTIGRPRLSILENYRHELGSLPFAEAHARVQALSPDLRELCLHLIVAHHGYARPLIRTSGASEPPTRLAKRAQAIASRFSALEKRWGPWGLAWWETLLRAADQGASRRNDKEGDAGG